MNRLWLATPAVAVRRLKTTRYWSQRCRYECVLLALPRVTVERDYHPPARPGRRRPLLAIHGWAHFASRRADRPAPPRLRFVPWQHPRKTRHCNQEWTTE